MNDPTMNNLVKRLDHIEQENRRWKILAMTTSIVLIFALLIGATSTDKARVTEEVRTKQLIVVDDEGRNRAVLTTSKGDTVFTLYDGRGKQRVKFVTLPDGSTSMLLMNKEGKAGMALAVGPDGESELGLLNKDSKLRAQLSTASDKAGVGLYSNDGVLRTVLGVDDNSTALRLNDKKGGPGAILNVENGRHFLGLTRYGKDAGVILSEDGLGLYDANKKERMALTVLPDGGPQLNLSDKDGKTRAFLTLLDDGDPALGLRDKYGTARGMLALNKGVPLMSVADATGRVIWSTPIR